MKQRAERVYRSSARTLLARMIARGWYTTEELAKVLVVSDRTLILYLEGLEPIPLERQACLATFLIDHVPALAAAGHKLRGQAGATLAYRHHDTISHTAPPPGQFWSPGR